MAVVEQDSLQDRLGKLKQCEHELLTEMKALRTHHDRTRLSSVFLEVSFSLRARTAADCAETLSVFPSPICPQYKSTVRDVAVTENTLWTVDRQLQLFERSDLDALIIGTLQSSTAALNGLSKNLPGVENVDELTETLQNRMQEVNEMTETVAGALQRGLDDDYSNIETELDAFLDDELRSATDTESVLDASSDPPRAQATPVRAVPATKHEHEHERQAQQEAQEAQEPQHEQAQARLHEERELTQPLLELAVGE